MFTYPIYIHVHTKLHTLHYIIIINIYCLIIECIYFNGSSINYHINDDNDVCIIIVNTCTCFK